MAAFFALPLRDVLLQGFDGAFVQGLTWGLFDTRQTFRVCSRAAGSFRDVHPAIALDAWSAYPMPKWPRAPQADVDCSSPLSFGLKFTLSPEARFNVELQTWLARLQCLNDRRSAFRCQQTVGRKVCARTALHASLLSHHECTRPSATCNDSMPHVMTLASPNEVEVLPVLRRCPKVMPCDMESFPACMPLLPVKCLEPTVVNTAWPPKGTTHHPRLDGFASARSFSHCPCQPSSACSAPCSFQCFVKTSGLPTRCLWVSMSHTIADVCHGAGLSFLGAIYATIAGRPYCMSDRLSNTNLCPNGHIWLLVRSRGGGRSDLQTKGAKKAAPWETADGKSGVKLHDCAELQCATPGAKLCQIETHRLGQVSGFAFARLETAFDILSQLPEVGYDHAAALVLPGHRKLSVLERSTLLGKFVAETVVALLDPVSGAISSRAVTILNVCRKDELQIVPACAACALKIDKGDVLEIQFVIHRSAADNDHWKAFQEKGSLERYAEECIKTAARDDKLVKQSHVFPAFQAVDKIAVRCVIPLQLRDPLYEQSGGQSVSIAARRLPGAPKEKGLVTMRMAGCSFNDAVQQVKQHGGALGVFTSGSHSFVRIPEAQLKHYRLKLFANMFTEQNAETRFALFFDSEGWPAGTESYVATDILFKQAKWNAVVLRTWLRRGVMGFRLAAETSPTELTEISKGIWKLVATQGIITITLLTMKVAQGHGHFSAKPHALKGPKPTPALQAPATWTQSDPWMEYLQTQRTSNNKPASSSSASSNPELRSLEGRVFSLEKSLKEVQQEQRSTASKLNTLERGQEELKAHQVSSTSEIMAMLTAMRAEMSHAHSLSSTPVASPAQKQARNF